jgi:ATP-dependent protease ClpP protease subunit
MRTSPTVFGTFCDEISSETIGRFYNNIAGASQQGVREIHLLFQSGGGSVFDGVSLYNYFKGIPIDIHLYNTGGVASAGLISFVGIERTRRYASLHAVFLLHRVKRSLLAPDGSEGHLALSKMLTQEDARCEAILRAESTIPDNLWDEYTRGLDVFITAQEAHQYGLIGSMRDFKSPKGSTLFDF